MSTTPLVQAFYDRIWNDGDLEAAWVILTPDFQFRGSLGSELRGIPSFLEYVRSVRTPLADYRCNILDCVSERDRAFAKMQFHGRHVGVFRGYPPTGQRVSWIGAALFEFNGSAIERLWVLGDLEALDEMLARYSQRVNDDTRQLLRHFLATLAYRTQKSVRSAPDHFGTFDAGHETRTPTEIVRHMTSVLVFARTFVVGGEHHRPDPLSTLAEEIDRFHAVLGDLSADLEHGNALLHGMTPERLLQGPFADAMTHAGQLAMLRRLAGVPVPPEDFSEAAIATERVGPDHAGPRRP